MGTRSVIGVMEGNVCKAVYCHWDGYYTHNGEILNRFYNDTTKASQLVAMGQISALGVEIGQQHDFDADVGDHESGFNAQCTFYTRDRGDDYRVETLNNWEDFTEYFLNSCGGEYAYIMKDGVWYTCTDRDLTLRVLAAELELATA